MGALTGCKLSEHESPKILYIDLVIKNTYYIANTIVPVYLLDVWLCDFYADGNMSSWVLLNRTVGCSLHMFGYWV